MIRRHPFLASLGLVAVLLLAGSALAWRALIPGLSSARAVPPGLEVAIATWLLHASVPEAERARVNPLGTDPAEIAAGHDLFTQKCAICHGYDGSGRTATGAGVYPRPPPLRSAAVQATPDGEIFYHIRNGIRNTAMPGWSMPDGQIWQIVSFLRALPITAEMGAAAPAPAVTDARYVGSATCEACHAAIYGHWKKTLMANVVRNPRADPGAIIPDLSKPDPLLTFTRDDIAFVYGSKWKQRYFKKVGDDYFPLPAQWDVTHKVWRKYFVPAGADWWAGLYPPDNFQRPTGPLCDGCHSVDYNIATKAVAEWNVGCERCHGPGSAHVANPVRATIVNPARLDFVAASDTCIQCHSQGQPLSNPIAGKYYDWPVGYHVGLKLGDFWRLEEHTLGQTTFTHFADGTAHKNRMQGNDFVTSLMYTRGVTCFSCHDPHGTDNAAMLREPGDAMCLTCHGPNGQNGPHAATLAQHTHHAPGTPGSACADCHMPKIAQTLGDVNVRSHTFRFVPPSVTETSHVPNACNACHTDKTTAWTAAALRSWGNVSPWRVAP